MILTHYSTDAGPRANSPTFKVEPSWGLIGNGVTVVRGTTNGVVNSEVTLRLITSDGKRTYALQLSAEEAQSLGATLLKGAALGARRKDHAELDAATQG